jgi:hypothetical protein
VCAYKEIQGIVELPDILTSCSDEELLARFCRGQTEAFGVLLRRYERALDGYLRRYLGDSDYSRCAGG